MGGVGPSPWRRLRCPWDVFGGPRRGRTGEGRDDDYSPNSKEKGSALNALLCGEAEHV